MKTADSKTEQSKMVC